MLFFFGIFLPAITLLVEAVNHMCAESFFDPLPTVGHVFAIAAVPFANGAALWTLRRGGGARVEAMIFAQAIAVAIAGVYTVMFLPITAMAIEALAFAGLGLLPLSPLLSLIASARALAALRRLHPALTRPARRVVLGGLAAGIGLLIALNVPAALTRIFMARAASADPEVSTSAILWLRHIDQPDLMMRATFLHEKSFDLLNAPFDVLTPLPQDQAREIYFRVTGRPIDDDLAQRGGHWRWRARPL